MGTIAFLFWSFHFRWWGKMASDMPFFQRGSESWNTLCQTLCIVLVKTNFEAMIYSDMCDKYLKVYYTLANSEDGGEREIEVFL